jgi:hypothetical protein
MSHEANLKYIAGRAARLDALLEAMLTAAKVVDGEQMRELVFIAMDLASEPINWLQEEQYRREKKNAQTS